MGVGYGAFAAGLVLRPAAAAAARRRLARAVRRFRRFRLDPGDRRPAIGGPRPATGTGETPSAAKAADGFGEAFPLPAAPGSAASPILVTADGCGDGAGVAEQVRALEARVAALEARLEGS